MLSLSPRWPTGAVDPSFPPWAGASPCAYAVVHLSLDVPPLQDPVWPLVAFDALHPAVDDTPRSTADVLPGVAPVLDDTHLVLDDTPLVLDHTLPGVIPVLDDTLPLVAGALPLIARALPLIAGALPLIAGALLLVAGALPLIAERAVQ